MGPGQGDMGLRSQHSVGHQASPLLEGADGLGHLLVVDIGGLDGRSVLCVAWSEVAGGLQQGADGTHGGSPVAKAKERNGLVRHTYPSGVEPSGTTVRGSLPAKRRRRCAPIGLLAPYWCADAISRGSRPARGPVWAWAVHPR